MKAATVDSVCAIYAEKGAKMTLKQLPQDPDMLLIEGDQLAFEFLGKLFLEHATGINGCGFSIAPRGQGSALFSKKSKFGLYLHRLPCDSKRRRSRSR